MASITIIPNAPLKYRWVDPFLRLSFYDLRSKIHIFAKIYNYSMKNQKNLIGISGGSGSGKHHLSEHYAQIPGIEFMHHFRMIIISPGTSIAWWEWRQKFDLPESIDLEAFVQDVRLLQSGQAIERLEYSFNNELAQPKHTFFIRSGHCCRRSVCFSYQRSL